MRTIIIAEHQNIGLEVLEQLVDIEKGKMFKSNAYLEVSFQNGDVFSVVPLRNCKGYRYDILYIPEKEAENKAVIAGVLLPGLATSPYLNPVRIYKEE